MSSNVDSLEVYEMRLEAGMVCHDHPTYRGLRKPRRNCPVCWAIYEKRLSSGTTERRVRQRGRVKKQIGKGESLSAEGLKAYANTIESRVIDTATQDGLIGNIVAHLTGLNYEKHLNGEA